MAKQVKTRHYKPRSERKTRVIPLRVTEERYVVYSRLAKAKGVRVSRWLREAADEVANQN